MTKWHTELTDTATGVPHVRGYKLTELMGTHTFTESFFLLLKGELPTKKEKILLDAILVACIDHGLGATSTTVARTVASTGNSLNTAVGAGILAQGDFHGGAIENCARILQEAIHQKKSAEEVIVPAIAQKQILYGFGHKLYKDADPRTLRLLEVCDSIGFDGAHLALALRMEVEIHKIKKKKLVLNIDGIIAALISDLGFDWKLGKGFFMLARMAGLIAHTYEEQSKEKPYRRLEPQEYEYNGIPHRELS